jgi:DNA-binding response OmpR family regulator
MRQSPCGGSVWLLSGMEVCKQLRSSNIQTPIIVLSAVGDEVDKVLLLEIGADDYVVKPFGVRELLARTSGTLALFAGSSLSISSPSSIHFAGTLGGGSDKVGGVTRK